MKKNNTKILLQKIWLQWLRPLVQRFRLQVKQAVLFSPWYGRTLLAMAVFLVVLKMGLVHEAYGVTLVGPHVTDTVINYVSVLASDFMIVGLIFVGAFLNAVFRKKWFKRYVNATALLLMLLYVSDMFSIYYFQSRFYLIDLRQFFSLRNSASYVLYPFLRAFLFLAVLFVFFLLVQKRFPVIRRRNMHLRMALVFFGMCVFFSLVNILSATDFHFRSNVLAINVQEISALMHGNSIDSLPGRTIQPYQSYFTSFRGEQRTGDLIVIFAESFSVVDSKRAGGDHNYFTGFDQIMRDGVTYTNFIANGCTSETAHIALLRGIEPWEAAGSSDAYKNYKTYTDALPVFFNNLGYHTVFLSTAPLTFLHQRDFLTGLHFNTIVGEEAFMTGKKYVFDAAPDEELYHKALDIIHGKPSDKPLFLALQTISSHKPYSSPDGGSERAAFAYADRTIKAFYDQLKKEGYFQHGTLVIVGDHHKMEPLERGEFQKSGIGADGRALLTVIGPGIKSGTFDDTMLQHTDIFSSLKYRYATGQVVLNGRFNDLLDAYQGRTQAIRYCQYVERQYIATDKNNNSWVVNAINDKPDYGYITSFKMFQNYTGVVSDDLKEINQLKHDLGMTVIGHQGGAPMLEAPDSYAGMKRAKAQGADGVEFDLSLTKDGYNVVMHGPDIGRTKCKNSVGKKNVSDFTLKEMKDNCVLLNGEPILTYMEALEKTQGRFNYYFTDIKVYDKSKVQQQMSEIMQTVKKLGMQKQVILSSYDTTGTHILESNGSDYTVAWDTFDPQDAKKLDHTSYKYFMLPYQTFTPALVSAIRDTGRQVVAYTVNNIQDMEKLYNMGIRIIMSDDVPLVIEWLRSKKAESMEAAEGKH